MTATAARAGAHDPEVAFESLRPRLHGVAYRMTGSVADADDLCQEAWLRWAEADHAAVEDPEAFLVTVISRLSLDRLRAIGRRRETYVGPYLPEPIVTAPSFGSTDPAEHAELADSLTFAFLVLLDALSPLERAVVLLHDVFGYRFDEVAGCVDRTPAAVRQIASRARPKLIAAGDRPEPPPPEDAVAATFLALLAAVSTGDIGSVVGLLAPDVVSLSDGGAERHAARRAVVGADRVARLLVNVARRESAAVALQVVAINGRPGLLFTRDGEVDMVLCADVDAAGRIGRVYSVLNPDKLGHVAVPG